MQWQPQTCPRGTWEMATPLQLAAAFQPCFQTAMKRIVHSERVLTVMKPPPTWTLHSGPLLQGSWNITQNQAHYPDYNHDGSRLFFYPHSSAKLWLDPFFTVYSRANILCDQIQGLSTSELSEIRKQHLLHGEFGHLFWFFTNRKMYFLNFFKKINVAWESLYKSVCV